jgi:hypothetical protein
MKLKHLAGIGVVCGLFTLVNSAFSQGTSITYQGTLRDGGNFANGLYDLEFSLYGSLSSGAQIGSAVFRTLPITNGMFSTEIDFGSNFAGASRWMELEVRTNGIGAFVVLSPRQRITAAPYATYALAAGTSSNVVSGSVVSSVNALKDDVLLQAGNNVSITPSGNTLTIAAANGGGSSIWSQLITNAYYNLGRVGIGTSSPQTPLEVNGVLRSSRVGVAGQYVQLEGGDPASIRITAQSVTSAEKTLVIQNLSGETTPGAANAIQFVLGTSNAPSTKMTITQGGSVLLPLGGTGGSMQFGTPNFETGMTIFGGNRADVRFDGTTLKLLAGAGAGIPASTSGITINSASGNVGIGGSFAPVAKLEIVGQDALRMTGFQPFLTLLDSNSGNARGRIQDVAGAMIFEPESFVSGANPNNFVTIANSGNVSVKNITIRGGADVAEPFAFSSDQLAPGSVVVIDDKNPGKLKLSNSAYDTRVAGIISGANGVNPGLSLHQEGILDGSQNVALGGRVYVLADAAYGAIKPGDLLTTSKTPGHAMKVSNHDRAQGAILGKAMSPLKSGKGMVLVLVTLQ